MRPLLERVEREGRVGLRWNLHRGQRLTLDSDKRIILVLAGWQSGKTEVGPPWLWREMLRCGPGDYLVASPTYPLMTKKVLPVFIRFFERLLKLGKFVGGRNIFTFSEEGCREMWGHVPDDPPRVLFGHAGDPESLESATVKAAWLDEAGQKGFRLASYEAVLGRLSISRGRLLLTSRPYDLGWMKQLLWDPWEKERKAGRSHPEIDIINFKSIENPAFSTKEYLRAKAEMPDWKFAMAYDGLFSRPAGMIYSSFDEAKHKIPRFAIPPEWPRYLGLDFGGVHTAGVFFAAEHIGETPTGRLVAYREYLQGERTAAEHTAELMKGEPCIPLCVGGSKSEGQWRLEFAKGGLVNGKHQAGLPVRPPPTMGKGNGESIVEVGINRVFGAFKRNEILIFDDLTGLLDELGSYSRELDDAGEPTEEIDAKDTYHRLDAVRYLISSLKVEAGGRFKASWLQHYKKEPGAPWLRFDDKVCAVQEITDRFLTVHCASTVKQTATDQAELTCVSAWGRFADYLVWIGCVSKPVEIPEIPQLVYGEYSRFGATRAFVSDDGVGKGPAQWCRRHPGGMTVIPFKVETEKLLNATNALGMMEAGRIWLPGDNPGFPLTEVEEQLLRFTGDDTQDTRDEIVATLAKAANVVMAGEPARAGFGGAGVGHKGTSMPPPPKPKMAPRIGATRGMR